MNLTIYQVDAFSENVFKGNPAAIIPLECWINDELMQNIAMENNISETAFFVKKDNKYEIRWFTPDYEIELCGHATLASAFIINNFIEKTNNISFYSHLSGELSVNVKEDLYELNLPRREIEQAELPEIIEKSFNIKPKEVYKGRDYMLVYENEEDVINIEPDLNLLKTQDCDGFIITSKGKNFDFISRFFAPHCAVSEDPVTGSAHCNLIPYWSKKLNKKNLTAYQASSRGGTLYCEDLENRVLIRGKAVLYLKGEIYI